MTNEVIGSANNAHADDVRSCPLQIEGHDLRGRLVRLGPLVDQVLSRHDSAETGGTHSGRSSGTGGTGWISPEDSDGIFTLSDKMPTGRSKRSVADYRAPGALRGYVALDQDKLAPIPGRRMILYGRLSSA